MLCRTLGASALAPGSSYKNVVGNDIPSLETPETQAGTRVHTHKSRVLQGQLRRRRVVQVPRIISLKLVHSKSGCFKFCSLEDRRGRSATASAQRTLKPAKKGAARTAT